MGPIVAAAVAVAQAVGAALGFSGVVATVVGATLIVQSTMQAWAFVSTALGAKPKGGASGTGAASGVEQQRQLGESAPRAIALGWTIVAGQECALWASGDSDDNRFNTRVIVISDWPTTLQKVWVRGRELTFEGDINTGWYACNQYRSKSDAARLWMRFVKGDWNQAADSQLISYANANASWTSDDRLRGVSALLIRREYDVDAFQSGAPDNDDLRVEVKNAPVYDWRDVSQNINDVTTWKPSENAIVLLENALCLLRAPAQYSPGSTDPIVGPGLDFSRRPLAKLTAMANICDELVSSQPRYRAGGVVNAAMTGREIIDRFAAACAGSWVSSGEGGYMRPGFVPAPVMDIPAGALQANSSDRYDPWARPDSVVNTVIGAYPDPSQAWQVTPLPAATDASWVALHGGVRTSQLDLSFVPYRDQAWRISTRKARGFQLMGSREFSGPHWLIELEPGDVVTAPDPALPYLSTKWWMVQRVVQMAKQEGLTTQITLNEIDSAIDAAPPAIGAAASFTPSSLARALAVPPVTIGQRVVSGGSGGQYPELTFLIPDTASQASGVVQLQGPATASDNALLAAGQIRNLNLSRGLLHGEPVVPGWYRWRAAGRDVDGSVGAFDATWQAAVQVTAPLVAGQAGTGIGGTPILNTEVGLGVNQVINSDLNQDTRGFFHTSETSLTGTGFGIAAGRNLVSTPNRFGARNVVYTLASVTSGFLAGVFLRSWAQEGFFGGATPTRRWSSRCRPSDRIFAAADVALEGLLDARIVVRFYDHAGVYVDEFFVTQTVGDGRVNGKNAGLGVAANFTRVGGFFTAPANSAYCVMAVEGRTLNGSQSSAWVFSSDWQLCVVAAGQTNWPPYQPGPTDMAADRTGENISGGFIGQGNQAQVNRFRQSTAPSSPQEGDIWEDTSTTPVSYRKRMSGAWVFQSEEGADITAQAVPSLEGPASVTFDVDGSGALSPGSQVPRTLQFIRKRGNTDVSSSTTWSIVSPVNITLGAITNGGVNVTAIAVGLSNFTVRSVRDGVTIDLLVAVVKNTIASGGGGGAKIARDDTATGIASGTYNAVLSGTINSGPAGLARVELNYLPLTWSGSSSNFQFRLTRAGVQLAETGIFNGIDGAGDIGDFLTEIQNLAGFYTVAAGTAVWALEAKRTSGSGSINTAAGELVVSQTET
jgi:hypothetical protein